MNLSASLSVLAPSRVESHRHSSNNSTLSPDAASSKSKEVAPFIRNLRTMLETESDAILRWTANGRAFEILDFQRMSDSVLPKYFKHRKYTSFQRQLNYFGFRKWTKSKTAVCTFSNDCFLRDQPELAWRISRKKSVPGSSSSRCKTSPRSMRVIDAALECSAQHIVAAVRSSERDERSDSCNSSSSADSHSGDGRWVGRSDHHHHDRYHHRDHCDDHHYQQQQQQVYRGYSSSSSGLPASTMTPFEWIGGSFMSPLGTHAATRHRSDDSYTTY